MAGETQVNPAKHHSDNNNIEPTFVLTPDGRRVGVDDYGKDNYKFAPDDKVYLCTSETREGPYQVEKTQDGKYILCDEAGNTVKDGYAYEEGDLVLYDPFAATS